MNWQGVLKAERNEPRLWIETVWLVDSIAPLKLTRTIPLRRGVNLIWAQPAVGDGPLDMGKSGHGVGKSAFCQLLRYVLLDSDWSDERLRDELKHKFSTGGVAARVHVLGENWVVYMPYVHQQTRRAMQNVDLEDLLAEGADNQFELYKKSIQEGLIKDLPVKQLPADGQQIEWQHILPWCIRDQGGRFADFFRWRSGRGVHLQMRAQSPPTLVKIILGVLQDVGAHCEEAAREAEITQLKRKLEEAKRKPEFLKSYAEESLRKLTDAASDAQFSTSGLFGADQTIEALAKRTLGNLEGEANRLLAKVRQIEARSISAQTQWKEKWKVHLWPRYHYRQQSATVKQNTYALEKLKGEWQALQPPPGDCKYGLIPFAKCDYILKRSEAPQIASVAKARTLAQEIQDARNLLPQCRANYRAGLLELLSIRKEKQALSAERTGLLKSLIAVNTTRHRISDALANYSRHQDILDGKAVDFDLADTEGKLREAVKALKSAQTALLAQEKSIRQRAKNLTETADSLAKAVFQDGEAFARFLPSSDKRLFELGPREAEAFSVLEILIADLACLLDSCRLQSHHPGFLVHDSPREAELSDATFYRLMDVLHEVAGEWSGAAPFQYIVTTTNSSMRDSLHPLLCMPVLGSDGPDSYLFGTDLTVQRRLAESGKSPEAV